MKIPTNKKDSQVNEELTPKQERFCFNYTQNSEFYGNATLSYAEAYGYELEDIPDDDALYLFNGDEIMQRDLVLLEDFELKKAVKIQDSSRKRMYDYCSQSGSRLRRNEKIQKRCRELLNAFMMDDVIDARLIDIILDGEDKDSMQAIREYNKLKQRIVEKLDVTTKGDMINTNDPKLIALAKEYEDKLKEQL